MSVNFHPLLDAEYHSRKPVTTLWLMLGMKPLSMIGVCLVFFIKSLPMLVLPSFLQLMIGLAIRNDPAESWKLWAYPAVFSLIVIQNVPMHTWYVMLTHKHIRRMERNLRGSLVRRLQQLSIGYHNRIESGRLQSKVLRDVDDIVNLSFQVFHTVVNAFFTSLWCLVLALTSRPSVALFIFILAPAAAGMIQMFRNRMARHNREYRQSMERMSSRVSEMLDAIPISRAHADEDVEIERAGDTLNRVYEAGMNVDRTNHLFNASTFVVMYIGFTLVISISAAMAFHGSIPVENIVLYNGLFGLVVGALSQLLAFTPIFSKGLESLRSLGEVLECPDVEWNQGKAELTDVQGGIEFDHVEFHYDDRSVALQDFSLKIHPGECVAFVGESGSGKSTLLNLAIGLYRPTGGRILLDGHDYTKIDLRSWRREIAVVPQQTILFSDSIRANITYGRDDVEEETLWKAIRAARLESVIENLPDGLDTPVGENGAKLSGGQRQRIAIARALVRDPKVIILDEATSALDVVSEREVQEALDHLVQNRTTLIVAHRLSTIRKAGKVVVMRRGRCIEVGSQEELMSRDSEFKRLKTLQA